MALAATVDKVTVPNPGGCWGAGFAVEGSSQRFVPLSQAIGCMKSMTVSKKIALQTVKAYDDMFRLSYAFYDVARDPSATFPDTIPTTWSVYSSPDQGKVDLSKKSAELMADIDANGRADGMLALKLNSIYALPRDGHTAIGALPPYSIALVLLDTSMNEDGAMIPEETYYLSLSRGEDGVIRPVYRYEDAEGNVVRERQIESINGENALDVLIKYTSNIGLGGVGSQLHSPGSRMNAFLGEAVVQDGSVIPGLLWTSGLTHDVSTLPDECLNITFKASGAGEAVNADGATETQWCFVAMIDGDSDGDYTRPVEFYDDQLATPGELFKGYDQFISVIQDAYPSVAMFGPQVSSLDGQPAARRALKQATNDPTTGCGSDYLNLFELSIDDDWNASLSGCREDPNSQKLVAAYKMLDDGVMVFRYPEFVSIAETQFAWRSAVRFARENNATKLLIDIIGNGGGDVNTQYFLRYAMYPEMTYDDWKDEYTQRVSPKMLQIIDYIAQGSEVVSLLNEYRDEFVAVVQDSDEESLEEVFGSTNQLLKFVTEAVSVAGLNLGVGDGESVQSLLSQTADRFERIANGTEPFSVDAFVEFLNTADGIITSQIGTYGRQTLFQGGSNVTTTGFYNLFTTPADYLTSGKQVVYDLPFESYVLLDNGVSGSSASTFEQGVRAYAKKYAGEVTPLTAVSFGCLGEAATCPLTQFSGGQLGGGNGQLNAVYASVPGVFATNKVASIMNATGVVPTESGRALLERYIMDLGPEFIEPIPDVPFLQTSDASYAYHTLYPHAVSTSENAIPMEFLNQPADVTIDLWPKPGSISAPYNGGSLPEIYAEASKYFLTKEQAASEPRLEFAPASNAGAGDESGKSGCARAFTAAIFFVCLIIQ